MNPSRRKATLKTIAAAAGVHPSTASRALMGKPGSRITANTIERVRNAATELEYEPNPWAKSLRTQRTMVVGLAIPRLTDVVIGQMFEAAQEHARDYGYQIMTVSAEKGGIANTSIKSLMDRRADGLILATASLYDPFLNVVNASGTPFILLNRRSGEYPVVCGEDELGGYLATRHLIDLGHTRIGHISGLESVSTGKLRAQGYRKALREAGLESDGELILTSDFDAVKATEAAETLLGLQRPPTAIFAANDISALAAMATARKLGMKVPDDLAVVGYNDTDMADLLPIPLTSVRVSMPEMGRLAVELLMKRMNGEEITSVLMKPELVVRESSRASS